MTSSAITAGRRQPRLGIDIGRVIIDGSAHPSGGDTAFFSGSEEVMIATPEMTGGFAAIQRLTVAFGGRVWLVSKCGTRVQQRTLRWLTAHEFWQRTGVLEGNIRFCRERADKRGHCVDLGLTHFIDDRLDVHEAVRDVVDHQFLFGPQRSAPGGRSGHGSVPAFVVPVRSWADAEPEVLATLP